MNKSGINVYERVYDNSKKINLFNFDFSNKSQKIGCNICRDVDLEKSDSNICDFVFNDDYYCKGGFEDKDINSKVYIERKYTLYIQLSNICFYSCFFCINKENKVDEVKDIAKLKKSICFLYDNNLIDKIVLTGGEPLMHKSIKEIISFVRDKCGNDIQIDINTSGYKLVSFIDFFKKTKVNHINISRHHFDNDICREIMGNDLVHDDVIRRIVEELKDYVSFRISVTFTDFIKSVDDIFGLIKMSKKLGVNDILFRNCYLKENDNGSIKKIISDLMLRGEIVSVKSADFCKCADLNIHGVTVSFRNADLKISRQKDYLREFLYKEDDNLSSSWDFDIEKILEV